MCWHELGELSYGKVRAYRAISAGSNAITIKSASATGTSMATASIAIRLCGVSVEPVAGLPTPERNPTSRRKKTYHA